MFGMTREKAPSLLRMDRKQVAAVESCWAVGWTFCILGTAISGADPIIPCIGAAICIPGLCYCDKARRKMKHSKDNRKQSGPTLVKTKILNTGQRSRDKDINTVTPRKY